MSQLQQRLVVGGLSLLVILVAIYFSYDPSFEPIFVSMVAGLMSLALLEYYALAKHKGLHPLRALGVCCALAYTATLYFSFSHPCWHDLPLLTLFAFSIIFFLAFFRSPAHTLVNLSTTVFGIIYLVIPLGCILKINYFFDKSIPQDGRLWLIYGLAVTKMADIGAYFFGKTFGKTKLAPTISPQKTLEGAIGGSCIALLTSIAFYLFSISLWSHTIPPLHMTFWQSLWIGALMSLMGQFGDLAESLLKRDAGVKDSSSYLPGLGGILDTMDSLVFTFPFLYFIMKMKFNY